MTCLGAEALYRAELIAKQADVIAALSIDVLQGTPKAFDYGTIVNKYSPVVGVSWGISSNGRALA